MLDIDTLQTLIVRASVLLPVVVGLVEAIKRADLFAARWLPLAATVLGGFFGFFVLQGWPEGVLVGIVLGLGSVGLFEFGKTTVVGN